MFEHENKIVDGILNNALRKKPTRRGRRGGRGSTVPPSNENEDISVQELRERHIRIERSLADSHAQTDTYTHSTVAQIGGRSSSSDGQMTVRASRNARCRGNNRSPVPRDQPPQAPEETVTDEELYALRNDIAVKTGNKVVRPPLRTVPEGPPTPKKRPRLKRF